MELERGDVLGLVNIYIYGLTAVLWCWRQRWGRMFVSRWGRGGVVCMRLGGGDGGELGYGFWA